MTQLSTHFSLDEFVRSTTAARNGIDNTPPEHVVANLRGLCEHLLEPLRTQIGEPIVVTSGYRCAPLNVLVGGKSNSAHLNGRAADIHVPGLPNEALAQLIEASGLPFDDLGREFLDDAKPFAGWCHVSWHPQRARKRLWSIP